MSACLVHKTTGGTSVTHVWLWASSSIIPIGTPCECGLVRMGDPVNGVIHAPASPSSSAPRTPTRNDPEFDGMKVTTMQELLGASAGEPRSDAADAVREQKAWRTIQLAASELEDNCHQWPTLGTELRGAVALVVARARAVHSEQARQQATPDALPTVGEITRAVQQGDYETYRDALITLHAAATRGVDRRQAYVMGMAILQSDVYRDGDDELRAAVDAATADIVIPSSGLPHVSGEKNG